MSTISDNGRSLRLDHAELVSPDDHNTIVGIAWDTYLEIAARLEPRVMASLLTTDALSASVPPDVLLEETIWGQHIRQWCKQWGFLERYAYYPAWNTLGHSVHAQKHGNPLPHTFICTWSGAHYPQWVDEVSGQEPGGVGIEPVGDEDGWNPHGRPHPFPELEGRLLAHYSFKFVGGNGRKRMFPAEAARMGTQVVLELPVLYCEPTAETRAEASARILEMIAGSLDADLRNIEHAHRAHGYRTPPEKRTGEHLAWLVRFQVLGKSRGEIARGVAKERGKDDPGFYKSHVGREIAKAAEMLGITLRDA